MSDPNTRPHVYVGDTGKREWVERLRAIGWGRVFVDTIREPYPGEGWMLDNGAFKWWKQGKAFPEDVFLRRVTAALLKPPPRAAVLPDRVGEGVRSLEYSLSWLPRLPAEFPWYLALQDGMTEEDLLPHVGKVRGLFLGGTDRFKRQAPQWCEFAHSVGLPFHYARAGTVPKFMAAVACGADSLDSSGPLWGEEFFRRFIAMWEDGTPPRYLWRKTRPIDPTQGALDL